jgi:hypothetical protein
MDPVVDPPDRKSLQRLLDDLRSRMRVFCNSDSARAILLAAGIASLFALAPHHDNQGERQTAVPACDSDLCRAPLADAAPVAGISPAASISPQTPVIDRVPDEDRHREPAPEPDRNRHLPVLSAKGNPPGIVVSRKTGARARVGVAHAAQFQAYIDDLERNHGARILFMGGVRPGHCSPSGMHPCGKALDVCQLRRGVVDPRCHLPPRRTLAQIAASHGLFEGGRWCNSDYGHAQLGVTAADCDDRTRIVRRQGAPELGRRAAVISYE